MEITENSKGLRVSIIVQAWIFISFLSISDARVININIVFPTPTMSISPTLSTAAPTTSRMSLRTECNEDCNGVCDGSAIMECKVCVGPGDASPRNCHGTCGTEYKSICGECLPQGEDDPLDCNNECFGTATRDSCNECTGGTTGLVADYLKDECGVCSGDNSTCAGCDGIPNSGLTFDACNVCGGDGSTCTEIILIKGP